MKLKSLIDHVKIILIEFRTQKWIISILMPKKLITKHYPLLCWWIKLEELEYE